MKLLNILIAVVCLAAGPIFAQNLQSVSSTAEAVPNSNPVLPPKWAFGILWGSYHTQGQVLDDIDMLRSGHFGGDLYWIDSSWLSSSYAGTPQNYICFQFADDEFPDPASMIQTLRQNNFRFGVWEWPWIDQGCPLFDYGVSNGLFIVNSSGNVVNAGGWHGNMFTGAFDYTNPDTVTWWQQLNQPLVDMGVNFFKMDTGGTYPSGGVTFDGSNSQDRYKALYRKTAYDMSAIANGGRGFILTHTQGSTGADQTPGMWTGDSAASFSGLRAEMQVASSLNDPSHTAFWCGDTGGYNNTPSSELYIRWLEYTTFTPCQEYFGSKTNSIGSRFPWQFGDQAQQIALQYSQIRYRLLPFAYSNAQIQYHEQPVQYPVHWIGSTQLIDGNNDSQILVQPVTSAGATSASIDLPAGTDWIHYWTGTVYPGGTSATVNAPIDQEPIFIKAGSIIPMGPLMEWVDQFPADPLTLDIYPAGATSYTLYEDDGATTAYMDGAFLTTTFTSDNTGGNEVVGIGAASGGYDGMLASRGYVLKINQQANTPDAVTRDGSLMIQFSSRDDFDAASEGWFFDQTAQIAWVKFSIPTSAGTSVALQGCRGGSVNGKNRIRQVDSGD